MSIAEYQHVMLQEIKHGIEDTGIYPGHIKIGMASLSPQEEKTLRAAAQVANETGLSVTVHPSTRTGGGFVDAAKILLEEGMNPERIVMAHVTGTFSDTDLKALVLHPESWGPKLDTAWELLDLGVNISMEFIGNTMDIEIAGEVWPVDWQRLAGIVILLKQGYAKQMVMGTDLSAKMATRRFGGEGYCRLTNYAIPTLRDLLGISKYAIRQMTVENPARILAY